jgi:hypothetical protein
MAPRVSVRCSDIKSGVRLSDIYVRLSDMNGLPEPRVARTTCSKESR